MPLNSLLEKVIKLKEYYVISVYKFYKAFQNISIF